MTEIDEDIWYPNKEFVFQIHEEMITEFGGYRGFETGLDVFNVVLKEAKKTKGIYRKAAVFLQRIVEVRIFCDGNHRTAYGVTDVFLRENGAKIRMENKETIIRFIKEIKQYSIDQIEAWLENGEIPQGPNRSFT
jgi:prophage maintenance system killer protein